VTGRATVFTAETQRAQRKQASNRKDARDAKKEINVETVSSLLRRESIQN
jgi:hypothetical protein